MDNCLLRSYGSLILHLLSILKESDSIFLLKEVILSNNTDTTDPIQALGLYWE